MTPAATPMPIAAAAAKTSAVRRRSAISSKSVPLCLRRRLELDLGRLAAAQLAAPLRLGVDLRAEEQRDPAQPEPGQHDHDRRERPPRLVVRAEAADVEGERARRQEPQDDGEHRAERQEPPARLLDVW